MLANAEALIENGRPGVVKVLCSKEYNEIFRCAHLGPHATELIGQAALMIGLEATVDDVLEVIHSHPTLTESIKEAMLASDNRAIHF